MFTSVNKFSGLWLFDLLFMDFLKGDVKFEINKTGQRFSSFIGINGEVMEAFQV